MAGATTEALNLRNITKVFIHGDQRVIANDKIDLTVLQGHVHAIVGENGAGKTTLMNVLYGLQQPDSGEIWLRGARVRIPSPRRAIELGIGMVHQHFMLVPSLSVCENIVLGKEPSKGPIFDRSEATKLICELARLYGLEIDPWRKIEDCALSVQQRVEILKALFREASILILDEPTAVLTPQETSDLFRAIRSLVDTGRTVIFITHKLSEVMEVADTVTVLRKGRVEATLPVSQTSMSELATLMVGREILSDGIRRLTQPSGRVILEVRDLHCRDDRGLWALRGVSFHIREGEILGIAGVGGNGQSELVEVITGLRTPASGRVLYLDQDITGLNAPAIRNKGIGHITGRRYERGVCRTANLLRNLIIGSHRRRPVAVGPLLNVRNAENYAKELVRRYDIKASGIHAPIMNLSGGNVQKTVVARELSLARKFIVAEEPTRGVDVGAKEYIHEQLLNRQREGYGILLVSTDLDEILTLSTRIVVIHKGRIMGERTPDSVTPEELGLLMSGSLTDKSPGTG